jgi:WXG100 family type VII secretion target
MSTNLTRADHDQLGQIAQAFDAEAGNTEAMLRQLRAVTATLQNGDWVGKAADSFYNEAQSTVFPALQRLNKALTAAGRVTREISKDAQNTEQEIAAILRQEEGLTGGSSANGGTTGAGDGNSGGATPGAPSAGGDAGSGGGGGWLSQVGGFFEGLWEGGKDTVLGLWSVVTDPIGTAKGLWMAVQNPSLVWEAFKKPFVDDWNSGNYGRAVGRGTFEVLSLLIPGAGAASKGAKAVSIADKIADAGRIADKISDVARATDKISDVGRAADTIGDTSRYLRNVGGADFIVTAGDEISATAAAAYKSIAQRLDDIPKVAQRLGVPEDVVGQMHKHMFRTEHSVAVGPNQFAKGLFTPFDDVAKNWQKVAEGTNTAEEAAELRRLIAHEYVESRLMERGLPYRSADPGAWVQNGADWINFPSSQHFGAHDLAPLVNAGSAPFKHWPNLFPDLPSVNLLPDLSNLDNIVDVIHRVKGG